MTVQNITLMGHPVLMTPAMRVDDPTAPDIAALVRDMEDTMRVAGGIGIAAPQIGVGKRVVIFYTPPNTSAGDSTDSTLREDLTRRPLTVLINPHIEILTEERVTGWEGCLSVPGMRGLVPRAPKIRYRGQGLNGHLIEREAHGFHAIVVQHECDHLDGILYPQRMTDLSTLQFVGAAEGGSYAPSGNPSDRNIEVRV